MKKVPITREGYEKLKKELETMIKIQRPENIKAIEAARAHGDITENAEYHAAKDHQAFIEGRINELKVQIGECEIIDINRTHDRAVFGARITMENIETGEEKCYMLVGPYESAPEKGQISIKSPLGMALIGKEEGDIVRVKAPGGLQEMEIVEIE
ncbi:MAG: transcription elongation factor GreA [Deltaproteobacteria bacterium]|nr:transcription elongation factor GreA [Deltaproteobacteria bacterium]MBW2051579.1 transcription elongation factor GreA [Deltaproteobacteria bacterium]MBW2139876.1 transcription elongation factor GreA [Deltaproteobacteria bacterium]MBW2323205.1 transcription elongation factor GreA [Deltaproteobacteria bacterium]